MSPERRKEMAIDGCLRGSRRRNLQKVTVKNFKVLEGSDLVKSGR
jgi:hypothetical protein